MVMLSSIVAVLSSWSLHAHASLQQGHSAARSSGFINSRPVVSSVDGEWRPVGGNVWHGSKEGSVSGLITGD